MRPGGVTRMTLELTGERTLPGIPRENYWYRRHVAAYRFAARLARGRVVDAASGEGFGAAILARRARVAAVELDAATTRHAARRYRSVTVIRGDLCRLPVRPRSLDAVVALQAIEHLHCAAAFLLACHAALRPGGTMVLSTPNAETFPGEENPFHIHEYTASELASLLRTPFGEVRLLGLRHGPLLRRLDRALGRPVQHALAHQGWEALPRWARVALRAVRASHFSIAPGTGGALDLVAVAR